MTLQGSLDVLTDGERARHPGSLAIAAYFDGASQAAGGGARMFPRFLTRDEEESWRDGWNEAKAEQRAKVARPALRLLSTPRQVCERHCPILRAEDAA